MTNSIFYKRLSGSSIQGDSTQVTEPLGTLVIGNDGSLRLHDGVTAGGNAIGGSGNGTSLINGPYSVSLSSSTGILTLSTASTILGSGTNPDVYIKTVTTNTTNAWKFGTDGILTLPVDTPVIKGGGTGSDVTIVAQSTVTTSTWVFGSTGTIVFPDATQQLTAYTGTFVQSDTSPYLGGPLRVNGKPIYGGANDGNQITLTTGTQISSLRSNLVNIQLGTTGIASGVWTFTNSTLTFPNGTQQTTAWTGTIAYSNITGTPPGTTIITGVEDVTAYPIILDRSGSLIVGGGSAGSIPTIVPHTGVMAVSGITVGTNGITNTSGSPISINVNGNIWNFNTSSSLTFPNGTVQSTAWTGTVAYSNVTNIPAATVPTALTLTNLTLTGPAVFNNPATFNDVVTFLNTVTYVSSTNTVFTDNIVEIHAPPGGIGSQWTFNDGLDVGIRFHYYNTTDTSAGLVLAQDTGALEWYKSGTDTGHFAGTYGTFKTGSIVLTGTATSTSTTTGALTVAGDVGIGGSMTVGGYGAGFRYMTVIGTGLNQSWTVPTGVTRWKVTLIGAGGGGGGTSGTAGNVGGGGGSGAVSVVYYNYVAGQTTMTVSVGAGGTGSSNANGTTGGASTSTYNAVTATAAGGSGGTANGAGGTGGAAGSGGTLNLAGQTGAAGGTAAATANRLPIGGNTPLGFGWGGMTPSAVSSSVAGGGYGGGGGGAYNGAAALATAGGAGAPGAAIIEY